SICLLLGTTVNVARAQDATTATNVTTENAATEDGARYAVVNISANYLRLRPDYESPLESQALMGTVAQIIGEEGYWLNVRMPDYTAWCTDRSVTPEMTQEEIDAYNAAPKYICTAWHGTLYSEPSEKSLKIRDLVEGDLLLRAVNVKGKNVTEKGFAEAKLPDGTVGYVAKGDVQDYESWKASRNATAENIIAEAMKFVGVPYLWGGASPNAVDCSGFVQHVYRMNGVTIPRNSGQQFAAGREVPLIMTLNLVYDDEGRRQQMVQKLSQAQPGDLLFFGSVDDGGGLHITHVGLYLGDYRMIHSSHLVRINSLLPGDSDCYENYGRLLVAARFLPDATE
ncbi:MAG: C40 family peptidase, partial [Bacteroidales bacterium]|nr:C40 family peptidase [Bacteroidales bacterium]